MTQEGGESGAIDHPFPPSEPGSVQLYRSSLRPTTDSGSPSNVSGRSVEGPWIAESSGAGGQGQTAAPGMRGIDDPRIRPAGRGRKKVMIDRVGLAGFLRHRRASLQPEMVGLPRGHRRRTSGLRREEVASICNISVDYYSRLERGRGPFPSEKLIDSIADGLHLSLDERDHLLRLAGHNPPNRGCTGNHISPGLLRIFDGMIESPVEIVTETGETLRQSPLARALNGDLTGFVGPDRAVGYRWFTDPTSRSRYHPGDHDRISRVFAAKARSVAALRGPGSRAACLVERLRRESPEFADLWSEQQVGVEFDKGNRIMHPELGVITVACHVLIDPEQSHYFVVYTAEPYTESDAKLKRLAEVIKGPRRLAEAPAPQTT
ncbi:helix-turn-helix transcriptional regulator [Phytohabitans flavus]